MHIHESLSFPIMKNILFCLLSSFLFCLPDTGEQQTVLVRKNRSVEAPNDNAIIQHIFSRNIGFGSGGIRFSALAVYDNNPSIFFLASGNGGVLKTTDGGKTFSFVFDRAGSSHIGAVAVSQKNPNIVWVGTGEGWQRNSVGTGDGIYKSVDGGKSWQHMGLKGCKSFSKIVLHPGDDNIVFAAGLGSPWGYGPDRGIFKTTDGGKSWKKVLYLDEKSAGTDLIIDPLNPSNMLAALWDHVHRPYGIFGSGPGSGIWRSTDGGDHWKRITKGLPVVNMGRIALDYFPKDPTHVAAIIEEPLPGTGVYASEDGGATWTQKKGEHPGVRPLHSWGRPFFNHVLKYHPTQKGVFYYENIHHFTKDNGDHWVGGTGDGHGIWIDPNDPRHFIEVGDVNAQQGWDLHDSLSSVKDYFYPSNNTPPLDQIYGVGYDMRKLYRVMGNCQDGSNMGVSSQGPSGSVTINETLLLYGSEGGNSMADPTDWATIYAGDRGMSMERVNLLTDERKDLFKPEFMRDPGYTTESAYAIYRSKKNPIRANYTRPFAISKFDHKTLYFGANRLMKSTDRGDHWKIISPDLSHDRKDWQVPDQSVLGNDNPTSWNYQCINAFSESALNKELLWCGTDDGFIQLTRNGGKSWTNLTNNIKDIPEYCWVSCIESSKFAEGRAYATFDNHKNDDLNTYVYKTDDFGKTWECINSNLPKELPCLVIREGIKNPDLLYLGTETGIWISLDRGKHWTEYKNWEIIGRRGSITGYFPTVRISDLQIHPRELDLIIGSHGRGAWILHGRVLEEMTAENRKKPVYFANPGNIYLFPLYLKAYPFLVGVQRPKVFTENTQPGLLFSYWLLESQPGEAVIEITDTKGNILRDVAGKPAVVKGSKRAGLNTIKWRAADIIHRPGTYKAILTVGGKKYGRNIYAEDVSDEVSGGSKLIRMPDPPKKEKGDKKN
jgi:photosystem II stability/assembly factor-like uncharacterized protein